MCELNTLSIQHRKHDFMNNRISGSISSKNYRGCSRTEFEEKLEAEREKQEAEQRAREEEERRREGEEKKEKRLN